MKVVKTIKATKINLFSLKTPNMRTFHATWVAFFLCFFGWFGVAPLMAVVREELSLTKSQIGNIIIASVLITVFARLVIGRLCDKYGPRITYTVLLILGSIPVMSIGFADSYESFLVFRLAIGVIGAAFVITQYHTSVMFAPNVVGTANATTAGWGNLGGGVTQMVMPLVFAGFVGLGYANSEAWRLAMVIPGVVLFVMGIVYYFVTQDAPDGNYKETKSRTPEEKKESRVQLMKALKDHRVWALFVIYGACFGVELTINNIAALYFADSFTLDVKTAGLIAGLFGLMNIFARSLGGIFGDKIGVKYGLKGRVVFLGFVILIEGLALILFSQMALLPVAIITLVIFSLFTQMSEGATYSVVPFINKKALGTVSGIVGAGGNAGAVAAGFLFKSEALTYSEGLLILGICVAATSVLALAVRFAPADEKAAKEEMETLLEQQEVAMATA